MTQKTTADSTWTFPTGSGLKQALPHTGTVGFNRLIQDYLHQESGDRNYEEGSTLYVGDTIYINNTATSNEPILRYCLTCLNCEDSFKNDSLIKLNVESLGTEKQQPYQIPKNTVYNNITLAVCTFGLNVDEQFDLNYPFVVTNFERQDGINKTYYLDKPKGVNSNDAPYFGALFHPDDSSSSNAGLIGGLVGAAVAVVIAVVALFLYYRKKQRQKRHLSAATHRKRMNDDSTSTNGAGMPARPPMLFTGNRQNDMARNPV